MLNPAGLFIMIQNWLGVPLGAKYRATEKSPGSKENNFIKNVELVKSILSITVDDVCIGAAPFYYKTATSPSIGQRAKLDKLLREFNSVAKRIAYDLLADGVSPYSVVVKGRNVYLYPILDTLSFILNDKKEVIAYDSSNKKLKDTIIFINYDRNSLSKVDDKKYHFKIEPKPIQLSNIEQASQELLLVEKSILRYRRDLSRILRFVTVEVGASQGGNQQDVLDNVSSGINANSISLEGTTTDLFDDEIPVFPTRKGAGKPEIVDSVPSANIAELADLDHVLGKIFLAMKFPKTYADFNSALDATAVSLIRGDIRYSRMLKTCRSLMENTINEYLEDLSDVRALKVEYKLQEIPNPEDEEVISALQAYQDFLKDSYDNIIGDSETEDEAEFKLQTYVDLLGDSSNLKSIERWVQTVRNYIKKKFNGEEEPTDTSTEEDTYETALGDETFDEPVEEPEFEETGEGEADNPEDLSQETQGEYPPSTRPPQF